MSVLARTGPIGTFRRAQSDPQIAMTSPPFTPARDDKAAREKVFYGLDDVVMRCPMEVGDYTDFYSSKEHASNVGAMFGRDPPLMHNWGCLPVGYHGRASSVVVSGTPVRRPRGLVLPKGATDPMYKECGVLDYELEMGFFVGQGNDLGW